MDAGDKGARLARLGRAPGPGSYSCETSAARHNRLEFGLATVDQISKLR